jgi:hypothetical protein
MGKLGGRCLYRTTPKQPGKNVVYPHSWSTAVSKVPEDPMTSLALSTDEQLEVSVVLCFIWVTSVDCSCLVAFDPGVRHFIYFVRGCLTDVYYGLGWRNSQGCHRYALVYLESSQITEPMVDTFKQCVYGSGTPCGDSNKIINVILSDIIADQDAAHPFELTSAEQEIRDHNSSCFVLGRSGTGCV